MTEISMQLSEITDSREVMESKPYPIVIYFIYLLLTILLISFLWMYYSEIDIVVKGTGMVRPHQDISVVNNKITGRIATNNLEEGLEVNKGDLLYTIMHDDLRATEDLLQVELEKKQLLLDNWDLYKESVLDRKNLFDVSIAEQKEFYFKYLGFNNELIESKETINANRSTLSSVSKQYQGMLTLKKSIVEGMSLFDDKSDLYALKYNEYNLKTLELSQVYEDAKSNYNKGDLLFSNGGISKLELESLYTKFLQSEVAHKQYTSSFMATLENDIENASLQIKKLESEMTSLKPESDLNTVQYLPIETKAIIEIDNQITTLDQEIRSIKESLTKTRVSIDKCIILAETDGVVNIKKKIAIGDYISAGDMIATVIPQDSKQFTIQITMAEKEISSIKEGDTIKYRFYALPYKEYGELSGNVTKISEDSRIHEETGVSYFVIEADVENKPLYSYKGEGANLKIGMSCQAQIITKSKKVLFFLLEKIDLWD